MYGISTYVWYLQIGKADLAVWNPFLYHLVERHSRFHQFHWNKISIYTCAGKTIFSIHKISSIIIPFPVCLFLSLLLGFLQRTYISVVSIEMIYFGFMHLWMDKEIRAYYYKKFGAKPVEEKVQTQPPKYIP